MEIDIYDFDKTIVPFDSGSLFAVYCFIHYPWCIICLPIIAVGMLLALLHVISFTQFKRVCFMFYPLIPKEKAVKGFWDRHEKEAHKWFGDSKRYSVVISASPDFLLDEISRRLDFDKLICTRHNPKTGAIIGENCRGEEKVRRLFEEFDRDEIKVIDVYSDSIRHDKAIFSLAQGRCYHIVKGKKNEFVFSEKYQEQEQKK
ncbi:MAG: haloacid dehalogenase-like hydrolase [Eubacterium sp.]|nr:haloacid dehalogenase-like hydrolase [Eubacterium sp.]